MRRAGKAGLGLLAMATPTAAEANGPIRSRSGEAGLGFLATTPAIGQSDCHRRQWPDAWPTLVTTTAAAREIRIGSGSSLAALVGLLLALSSRHG